jgi:hypothetical protein
MDKPCNGTASKKTGTVSSPWPTPLYGGRQLATLLLFTAQQLHKM